MPTIPTVEPRGEGTRSPASRIISKEISIINISIIIVKGTAERDDTIENNSSVGSNSL